MKIIQINASYKPAYIYGGPALSVSRLCEGLVRTGADLEVLTTTANGAEELPVEVNETVLVDGVPVTYFKRLTKDHTHFSPGLLKALRRKLKGKGQRRIVHIHAWWNLVSVLSCWIAKRKHIPVVLSPRGTLSGYSFGNRNSGIKQYIHRFLGRNLLEYCHFHVTSEQEKEDILRIVKPKSITVISNFVYLPAISREAGNIETTVEPPPAPSRGGQIRKIESLAESRPIRSIASQFRLLFLSRIEEKKGLDILFNALKDIDIPYQLDIAGSGDNQYIESLKQLAATIGIDKHINWIGQQSQQAKWQVLEQHDLLVLTSHSENFANVVIECLATGTPVLISNKVGVVDYVAENNLGWICDLSAESVKKELLDAYKNRAKAESIRLNAPAMIRVDFEEDQLINMFRQIYSGL